MKKILTLIGGIIILTINTYATTRTSVVSGNWDSPATWGGTVPAAGDDVVIASGTTVTININPANIVNVTVSGTLQWDATGTGRTWTVTGGFTINSGGTFNCAAPGSATTHTLTYNGTNFSNSGTLNLVNGTNKCNVIVGGTVTQQIGGSGASTFNKLTINNTGGLLSITAGTGVFSISESNTTKLTGSITTLDSLVIQRGLVIGCATNSATFSHTVANLAMGSSTTKITSSVSVFTGDATITINTGMELNDATNANVTLTVNGSFTSPNMSQANSAIAVALLGPNCVGGANNATSFSIGGVTNIPDLIGFVGNSRSGGAAPEPNQPLLTFNGSVTMNSSKSHTIDIPFTSNDIVIKTFYFGRLDTVGTSPKITLNGGTVSSPKVWTVPFAVFNAPVQVTTVLGMTSYAQISESSGDWVINGNWKVPGGDAIAVHSDHSLTINGSVRTTSGGEIDGSETQTPTSPYNGTNGPLLTMGPNGVIYTENPTGLGNGTVPDSSKNVTFKNRTADLDWNLTSINSNGKVDYNGAAAQTITSRTYNKLSLSGGAFTKTLGGTVTANDSLIIASQTTLANAGFNSTAKKSVTNSGTHSGTGVIILGGSTNQSLGGSGIDWGNVQLNNSSGATCNAIVTTSGNFDFTSGILNSSSSNVLSFTVSGTNTNSSNNSFVNGPVSKTTSNKNEFIFPVGQGSKLRSISVIPNATATSTWTAEYFNSPYSNTTSVTAPITSVSNVEYWELDRNSGTTKAMVKLTWNSGSGLTDTLGNRVAAFISGTWLNDGVTAATGDASSGTITSATQNNFNVPFTLGEATTLTTSAISGSPFCPGAVVNVPFNSSGTFNSGNLYTAQLSNNKGSFTSPTDIGTLNSTANSGSVPGTIPTTTKGASKYRIRVVSSNPVVTGTDNGTNLTVNSCDAPGGLTASSITSSSATISWSSVTCAFKYTLQYRVQGTSTWTKVTVNSGTSKNITGLTASTTYEYEVQTICTSDKKSKSSFTAIQTFTTLAAKSEVLVFNNDQPTFSIYPNPAKDDVLLSINSSATEIVVSVYNLMGQKLIQTNNALQTGLNEIHLTLSSLPAGSYFVRVQSNDWDLSQKLIKE